MSQSPQTYGSNDSFSNPSRNSERSGSLMSGLAFGVAT